MGGRRWAGVMAALIVAVGLGYAAFQTYGGSQVEQCYACRRAIHANSRTVAIDSGRTRVFCCPACALSERAQEGKSVRITGLTSYLTGARLSPETAFVVKGSDVNPCAHARQLVDEEKRPADLRYDRCSPSIVAFAERGEAVGFAREHGGVVLPFRELASSH